MLAATAVGQSANKKQYSESVSQYDRSTVSETKDRKSDDDIVRVETDLITIPVRVTTRGGRPVPDIKQSEFRIFEDGEEQEIAFFGTNDAPFTVALLLDMSYSSVFKLEEIQAAAMEFIAQLKPNDKVMIVSFDRKVRVLCEVTDNRKALRYAIEGSKIGSGTSVYDAV
jgi:VWFA-related protein